MCTPSAASSRSHATENFRVWDSEWEIPVPTVQGKPQYEVIQRAW